jgi:predicted RNA-binding protein YlqC (UPF0109 family)
MKQLLEFVLKGILGEAKFDVEETEDNGRIVYTIKTDPENVGFVIGKGGKIIKAVRNILRVRATLEKKAVAVNIGE